MRRTCFFLGLIGLSLVSCAPAFATADAQEWPCFLSREEAALFSKGLAHDLETSRQRLIEKRLGSLEVPADSCPSAARARAGFERELTTLFDATISSDRVMARLRARWADRWNRAQCEAFAAARAARAARAVDAGTNTARAAGADVGTGAEAGAEMPSLPELLERWTGFADSGTGAFASGDRQLARRVKDTLEDMKTELTAVQRDANSALQRALPPIVQRNGQVVMTALDACIAEEEARLARTPDSRARDARTPDVRAADGRASDARAPDSAAAAATGLPPGLSIDPPHPFVVTRAPPGKSILLAITSPPGKPVAANVDGTLCGVGFKAASGLSASYTQAAINAIVSTPVWQEPALATLRTLLDVEPGREVELLGIRGMEFIGTPKAIGGESGARSRNVKNVRIYLALFDTPKGRTTLSCATMADALPGALPVFRSIRDTLRPAR